MSPGPRIPTDGGTPLRQTPFGVLAAAETGNRRPAAAEASGSAKATPDRRAGRPDTEERKAPTGEKGAEKPIRSPVSATGNAAKNRGRVDITRETAGRGGKTVTVVSGFVGIGQPEKAQLAKKMQRACGAGGTVKDGRIEIQGDKREQVARILAEAGFRPVFAGG
jgi:translation initiation factor 1